MKDCFCNLCGASRPPRPAGVGAWSRWLAPLVGARGIAELLPARGARGGAGLVARAGAERVVVPRLSIRCGGRRPTHFWGALFPTFSHYIDLASVPHASILAGFTVPPPTV